LNTLFRDFFPVSQEKSWDDISNRDSTATFNAF